MTNAFDYKGQPSSMVKDPRFAARKGGRTQSQIATATVERLTRENGRNPGAITGISKVERAYRRGTPIKGGGGCR